MEQEHILVYTYKQSQNTIEFYWCESGALLSSYN